MLAELETAARPRGHGGAMVLETGTRQPEAIGLYTSAGYVPMAPFGYLSRLAGLRCFAKRYSASR